jgi:energy-coupling factor transporter ATP-binding protein EcfA2
MRAAYGSFVVLEDVDLTVAYDETVAVTGVNGAGKSTPLRCLAGFRRPDAGRSRCSAPRRAMTRRSGGRSLWSPTSRPAGRQQRRGHGVPGLSVGNTLNTPDWCRLPSRQIGHRVSVQFIEQAFQVRCGPDIWVIPAPVEHDSDVAFVVVKETVIRVLGQVPPQPASQCRCQRDGTRFALAAADALLFDAGDQDGLLGDARRGSLPEGLPR